MIYTGYRKIIAAIVGLLVLAVALIPTISKADVLGMQDTIGEAKAKQIAFADASITADKAQNVRVNYDRENGVFVYEVDFAANGNKYEYDINAQSGAIAKKDVEAIKKAFKTNQNTKPINVNADKQNTKSQQTSSISAEEAKQIAFADASTTLGKAQNVKVNYDRENGVFVYEVDFVANGNEYEYDINAKTGEIVKKDVEAIRTAHKAKTNTKTQNNKPQHKTINHNKQNRNKLSHSKLLPSVWKEQNK